MTPLSCVRTHRVPFSVGTLLGCLAALAHADTDVVASDLPDLTAREAHAVIELAPENRWITKVETRRSGFDHWFDDRGRRVPLGNDYDGLTIDSTVFPVLAALGSGADIGTTAFHQEVDVERVEISLGYGVSRDLTVGVILPFGRTCSSATLTTSGASLGRNPLFDPTQPIGIANFPFAPAGGPIAPLDTAGAVDVLTNPIYGFGYAAPAKRCKDGWGDPTVGFLARVHGGARDTAVLGVGLRFGLAKDDDPDDLFDAPLSDGSNDLVVLLEHYHDFAGGWDSRLSVEGNLQFADHVDKRVPASSDDLLPAANTRAEVERDLGDWMQADIEIGKSWGDWRASATAHFYRKGSDRYSRNGVRLPTLEKDTHQQADQWRLSLSWSGYAAYRRGDLPLPLALRLETQQTRGGTNMPDIWDWYLTVSTAF